MSGVPPAPLAISRGTWAISLAALLAFPAVLPAQFPGAQQPPPGRPISNHAISAEDAKAARATLPLDSAVRTEGSVVIKGSRVPYTATTGTLPVYDETGTPIASVFYVFYQRSDVQDRSERPITISFNGGPGSSSVWMHLGYTGPKRLNIDDEGNPIRPFGIRDNPHSILDVTDIVFVDPINVGLSRAVEGTTTDQLFGVRPDITYLAQWIELFISRNNRWASPKFLIGESYGTTRVSGLARELQSRQKMFFNGVVLVSPTGLGIDRQGPVREALSLPHYAATAWYHGQLDPELQQQDLEDFIGEVETFTLDEYIPALARGGFLDAAARQAMAQRVARYAGVSAQYVDNNNLVIPISSWRKELLRSDRLTVGRLDARYQGVDSDAAGLSYDYDPAMSSWNHSFTPAMNIYLKEHLNYDTDLTYVTIGGNVRPWDNTGGTVGENLRLAMAENPQLHTMIQSGYYDGGTDYFSAKYTMWNMDRSGQLSDRFSFKTYRSGHMMYLRDEDLATSNEDLREFMRNATPAAGTPALWGRRVPANGNGR